MGVNVTQNHGLAPAAPTLEDPASGQPESGKGGLPVSVTGLPPGLVLNINVSPVMTNNQENVGGGGTGVPVPPAATTAPAPPTTAAPTPSEKPAPKPKEPTEPAKGQAPVQQKREPEPEFKPQPSRYVGRAVVPGLGREGLQEAAGTYLRAQAEDYVLPLLDAIQAGGPGAAAAQAQLERLFGGRDRNAGRAVIEAAHTYAQALHNQDRATRRRKIAQRQRELQAAEESFIEAVSATADAQGYSAGMRVLHGEKAYVLVTQMREGLVKDRHWYHTRGGRFAIAAGVGLLAATTTWLTGGLGLAALPFWAKLGIGTVAGSGSAAWNAVGERRLALAGDEGRQRVQDALGHVSTGIAAGLISIDPKAAHYIFNGEWDKIGRDIPGARPEDQPAIDTYIEDQWRGGARVGTWSANGTLLPPTGGSRWQGLNEGAVARSQVNNRGMRRGVVIGGLTGAATATIAAGVSEVLHSANGGHPVASGDGAPVDIGNTPPPSTLPNFNIPPDININQHAWNFAAQMVGPEQANNYIDRAIEIANQYGGHYTYDPGLHNGMILFDGHTMVGNQRDIINGLIYGLSTGQVK